MKSTQTMLEGLKRQSCEILATIKKQCETDYINDEKNFDYLTERLQILSEKFACCVRDFAINTYSMKRCEVYDNASEMLGIEVYKEGDKVVVDLPFLLPRKKDKDAKFVGDPLRHKFEQICEKEDLKIREKVVVCIIHVYDNVNRKAKCYDYDNLESKRILDIITLYTMTDDSPKYCDVYHTVEFSDTDKTRVIIMPADEFWKLKSTGNFG